MEKIRVLVADDHSVLRAGLRVLLDGQPDMQVVSEAADAAATLSETERVHPEVVLLDLSMPGGGTAMIRKLHERLSSVRVVVLTMYDNATYLSESIANGADGFVSKTAGGPDLLAAIRSVHAGRSFFGTAIDVSGGVPGPAAAPAVDLSPREVEVLKMVAAGHTNKEVAQALQISIKTVETYRSRILEKAGLKSRAQLVRFALELGLIGPPRP